MTEHKRAKVNLNWESGTSKYKKARPKANTRRPGHRYATLASQGDMAAFSLLCSEHCPLVPTPKQGQHPKVPRCEAQSRQKGDLSRDIVSRGRCSLCKAAWGATGAGEIGAGRGEEGRGLGRADSPADSSLHMLLNEWPCWHPPPELPVDFPANQDIHIMLTGEKNS